MRERKRRRGNGGTTGRTGSSDVRGHQRRATTRRRFLAATGTLALGGVAGCTALDSPGSVQGTLAIRVDNRRAASETVSVTVTGPDGRVRDRFEDETIPAGVSESFELSGYGRGRYDVGVRGGDWATSGLWDPAVCRDAVFVTTLDEGDDHPVVHAESTCRDASSE